MDPNQTTKTPVPVIVIAWLSLLAGVVSLLAGSFATYLGVFGGIGALSLLGVVNGLVAVALIVASFGLRKMKKWALYFFVVAWIINIAIELTAWATNWIIVVLAAAATIYLLSIRKKFV